MAPSRGEIASNPSEAQGGSNPGAINGISSHPTLPQPAGIRQPLYPIQESYRVVTDIADSSEGSEMRTFASNSHDGQESMSASPTQPVPSSTTSSGSSTAAIPPQLPALDSDVVIRERRDVQETAQGSSMSFPLKPNEPVGPQHEMEVEEETSEQLTPLAQESRGAPIIERNKMILLHGLSLTCRGGSLTLINLSRRGLTANDAMLLKRAMQSNPHLSVLKLSYNNLGDGGAAVVASGFVVTAGESEQQRKRHHKNLSVLDLGFNGIGDEGCAALALHAVAGNHTLRVLYLSGNNIGEQGTLSLSGAMLHGCSLTSLHLSANCIGAIGIQAIARAVAENEACGKTQVATGSEYAATTSSTKQEQSRTMEELYLGETAMTSNGFVPIPSMLLTNLSLRVLCLSHNGIDDQSMALLAQALSRNKNVPLESVQLSFNEITCAGVECFMNAIWGSKTLRELKLDNNKIQDRGAQLAAVALTAIDFEVLDLGFNRITNVGIKALMKSLSESKSLQSLSLSGISLDATACKALSYALAYNTSLRSLYVDNCQVAYSGQRHIVAGIVSNRWSMLRVVTGFDVGAIAVTLQLPQIIEAWSNDKVLRFVHFMWREWNKSQDEMKRLGDQNPMAAEGEVSADDCANKKAGKDEQDGPAAPATVVHAAKKGLAMIGNDLDSSLHIEPYEREISETSPVVPANATMLERTHSGTIRVPPLVESNRGLVEDMSIDGVATSPGSNPARFQVAALALDPLRKNRNLEWLREHYRSLNEVSHLPFNSADLWQLHQYFFSPVMSSNGAASDSPTSDAFTSAEDTADEISVTFRNLVTQSNRNPRTPQCSPMPTNASKRANLGRNISFQMLGEAVLSGGSSSNLESLHKRRSTHSDDEEEESEHATKRARNFKPRIAYYPRIREKVEALVAKPSQEQTLALLRLLKFVESVMFQGKNPVTSGETIRDPEQPSPDDVEMIILDLL